TQPAARYLAANQGAASRNMDKRSVVIPKPINRAEEPRVASPHSNHSRQFRDSTKFFRRILCRRKMSRQMKTACFDIGMITRGIGVKSSIRAAEEADARLEHSLPVHGHAGILLVLYVRQIGDAHRTPDHVKMELRITFPWIIQQSQCVRP